MYFFMNTNNRIKNQKYAAAFIYQNLRVIENHLDNIFLIFYILSFYYSQMNAIHKINDN